MGKYNITCNAICPGVCNTEMAMTQFSNAENNKTEESITKNLPIQRLGEAKDIADLCKYLASEGSSYMTGACLDINGGNLML